MTDRYTYQELGLPEETVNRMLLFKLINLIILTGKTSLVSRYIFECTNFHCSDNHVAFHELISP